MRAVMVAVASLLTLGCSSPAPSAVRLLRVLVRDDRGAPLAGVPVEVEGISATTTAADGTARVSLSGQGAPRARVGVKCPALFRPLEPRHVARTRTGGGSLLELGFVCRPRLRTLVVVVRAPGGEGLVVRADGEPLGRVATDGTLHAVLQRPPDGDVRLMLDTSDRAVTPRNPARELRVADRDELVVFDEQLTPVKPRAVRTTTAAPKAAPPPALPYAIRSTR